MRKERERESRKNVKNAVHTTTTERTRTKTHSKTQTSKDLTQCNSHFTRGEKNLRPLQKEGKKCRVQP